MTASDLLERVAAELKDVPPAAIDFTRRLLAMEPTERVKLLLATAIDCAKAGDLQEAEGWYQVARRLDPQVFAAADEEV
nr:hypothetical protein [Gammaproteobacteria bacterium]